MSTPNFRTLDLNLLRVFDEVMAEGSLTRAARNLSLTQPAVSNALRRLRETLGDELLQRSGQGMALRTAMRGALIVSLRRNNLNRTGGTSHKHKDRPWAALVVHPERD